MSLSLFEDQKIVETMLEDEIQSSYLDYSMSVIVSRALPDVRDGLKPVHRRLLFAMQEMGMGPNSPYKKSAKIVGDVLGRYHPHGDSSVYDAMVRLAQEWSIRYPLIDGQGNYGSIDGDPPAAYRYTEARLSSVAVTTLSDIDKNTVDFKPNYDDSLEEPTVLPSILPTLLVNGASGIAVGMATNIPPHNLTDIVKGLQLLISNPEVDIEEIIKVVKAPDFPTYGIIYGYSGVRDALLTGRGKILLRARATIEESEKSSKQTIIVTELPYQVNKSLLHQKIKDLVTSKVIDGITEIRDESSSRVGIRLVIELRKDVVASVVLNNLYKHSQMQVTFGVIMLSLVKGRPRVLNIKEMMQYFIEHRNEVIIRRCQFELEAAEKRAHILEGLIIALNNIDEVIAIIKSSKDGPTASLNLQEKFKLTEIQAKAILEMRLQRLTSLEIDKIREEYAELIKTIENLKAILASKALQMQIISDELENVKNKYGDERRTEIIYDSKDFSIEDMIANEEMIITISRQGLIKRTKVAMYKKQNKGGRGSNAAGTNDDDFIEHIFQASNHDYILFFTDRGRVYKIKVYDLPELSRQAKGKSIANVIAKEQDENITAYITVTNFEEEKYIVMCTRKGTIKKTDLRSFANIRQSGIIAINLDEDDKMIGALLTDGKAQIMIGTSNGLACRFVETDVRPMGRAAAGVRGISLQNDDFVVSMLSIQNEEEQVLIVGEKGLGKRTEFKEFRLTKRGAKGVRSMNVTDKTGKVVRLVTCKDDQDLVIITNDGILIRIQVNTIRSISRNTQGVKVIDLKNKNKVSDVTIVNREEDTPDENENASEPNSQQDSLEL